MSVPALNGWQSVVADWESYIVRTASPYAAQCYLSIASSARVNYHWVNNVRSVLSNSYGWLAS